MKGKLFRRLGFLMILVLAILIFSQGIWLWQQLKEEKQNFAAELENALSSMVNFHALQGYRNYPKKNPNTASLSLHSRPRKTEKGEKDYELARYDISTKNYTPNFSLYKAIEAAFTNKALAEERVKMKVIDSLFLNNFEHLEIIKSYKMQLLKNDSIVDEKLFGKQGDDHRINHNNLLEISIPLGTKKMYTFAAQFEIKMFSFLSGMIFSIGVSGLAVILVAFFMYWLVWALNQRAMQLQWREQSVRGIVHDLKSPLSYVYTLLEYIAYKESEDSLQKQVQSAGSNVFKLSQKLELILSLFKGDHQKLTIEPGEYPLSQKCEEILSELLVIYQEKQAEHELDIPSSLQIKVDSFYFEAALRNLLDNAFKYSESPAKVKIKTSVEQDKLHLSIQDSGAGIARKEQKRIFKEFYRLKTRSKGHGIGLAFSQQIIKAHKGAIKLESEMGKGSTFSIILPHEIVM